MHSFNAKISICVVICSSENSPFKQKYLVPKRQCSTSGTYNLKQRKTFSFFIVATGHRDNRSNRYCVGITTPLHTWALMESGYFQTAEKITFYARSDRSSVDIQKQRLCHRRDRELIRPRYRRQRALWLQQDTQRTLGLQQDIQRPLRLQRNLMLLKLHQKRRFTAEIWLL